MQTGNQTISFEVKSQLAKLLATENITMRHSPSTKTAYFDVKNRELILPVWQNISEDLYDMLVVHEVGHALDSPMDKWLDAIDVLSKKHHENPTEKNKLVVKAYLNVVEDARIDKRQKRRYPGSRRNYVNGYKELHERDFFGIAKRDVNSLAFIDRANILFKHGAMYNIKFTDEEREFIKRMENAETFEDVVEITSDIYAYSLLKKQEKKVEQDQEDSVMESEKSKHGEMDEDDKSFFESMEEDDSDEDDDDNDLDASYELSDDESDDEISGEVTDNTVGGSVDDDIDVPETEKAAEESVKNIVMNDNYRYIYLDTPEMNHEAIIDDYPVVIEAMQKEYDNHVKHYGINSMADVVKKFTMFRNEEQETISFMVKEFEMRKAADTHSRVAISKTGVIDTNKIHSYKYNDDIFRRLTTLPQGKNHGFVMFMDWSGSMLTDLTNTMKQLFSLVMFCKRVQIPFEVYLFRNVTWDERQSKSVFKNISKENLQFDEFRLRNVLSSRMNTSTLNKAYNLLWYTSYGRGCLKCDPLDSTPLNQTIMAADYIVNKFRKQNKVQIVNTIILTDGASDPVRINFARANMTHSNGMIDGQRVFIRDHITKKNYYVGSGTYGHKATETFLKMLKERTNSNVIGFFITQSLNSVTRVLGVHDTFIKSKWQKSWRENNYVGIDTAGYDEYYAINVKKASEQSNLNVNSDMTQKAVIREFMKYSDKKTTNRVMLSKFMKRVA